MSEARTKRHDRAVRQREDERQARREIAAAKADARQDGREKAGK